jgi:O-antigen ligase
VPAAATPAPAATKGVNAELVLRLEDEIGFPPSGEYRPAVHRTFLGSSGRVQAWDGALRQGAKRPVAGYGFGTEEKVFIDRFFAFEGRFVENSYLGLFLQLGLAGVVLFATLLVALVWSAARIVRRSGPAAASAGVLVAACLIGMTQSGLLSVGNIAATSIWICVLLLPVLAFERSA